MLFTRQHVPWPSFVCIVPPSFVQLSWLKVLSEKPHSDVTILSRSPAAAATNLKVKIGGKRVEVVMVAAAAAARQNANTHSCLLCQQFTYFKY